MRLTLSYLAALAVLGTGALVCGVAVGVIQDLVASGQVRTALEMGAAAVLAIPSAHYALRLIRWGGHAPSPLAPEDSQDDPRVAAMAARIREAAEELTRPAPVGLHRKPVETIESADAEKRAMWGRAR